MVKRGAIALLIVFIVLIVISSVKIKAPELPGASGTSLEEQLKQAEKTIEETQTSIEELQKSETRSEALKKIWGEYIEKTAVGKALIRIGLLLKKLDPIFLVVPGIPFAWSGLFLLAVIITLAVFALINMFVSLLPVHKLVAYLIALGATLGLSFINVFKFLAAKIYAVINYVDNFWVQILLYVIFITVVVVTEINALSIKKKREKKRKEKEEMKREARKAAEEVVEKQKKIEEKEKVEEKKKEPESLEEEYGRKLLRTLGESLAKEPATPRLKKVKPVKVEKPFK